MLDKLKNNPRFPLLVFAVFYLFFILFTFRDYGITTDEWDSYFDGAFLLKHWYHGNSLEEEAGHVFSPMASSHNYSYTAFLHILSVIYPEKLHFFNLVLAFFGYWAVYLVLLAAYGKPWWAVLGPFFLFLTYRFSGDVPANPKDAPFAMLYFCSLAWIYLSRLRIKDTRWESIVLGTLIGWATSVRVIGITPFPILILYRLYEHFQNEKGRGSRPSHRSWFLAEWPNFLTVFLISQFWLLAFWPYLGSNYFGNLIPIFSAAKKFPWLGHILFKGDFVDTTNLPWDYLLTWILISLPVFVLFFLLASIFLFLRQEDSKAKRLYVLLGSVFIFHLGLYWTLKPIIYNALRHYLFLVPIAVVLAALSTVEFFKGKSFPRMKKAGLILLVINILSVLLELARLYPYQYVYFNELVGGLRGAAGKFEADYWFASSREASLWLRKNEIKDPSRTYRIKVPEVAWQEAYFFSKNMKSYLTIPNPDYEIATRRPPENGRRKLVHVVEREGVPLASVFKYDRDLSPGK